MSSDEPEPLPKPYADVKNKCIAFLMKHVDNYDSEEWRILQSNNEDFENLEIAQYEKPSKGGVVTVRGRLFFPGILPKQILKMVVELQERPRWDSQMQSGEVFVRYHGFDQDEKCPDGEIKKSAEYFADIAYLAYKGAPMVSQRDLCLLRVWQFEDDGESCVLVSESVQHEKVPCKSGFVRAELRECGYQMKRCVGKDEKEGCLVTYISSLDFKGSFPSSFTNVIMRQQPKSLEAMRKLLNQSDGVVDNQDDEKCSLQ